MINGKPGDGVGKRKFRAPPLPPVTPAAGGTDVAG